MAGCFIAVPIIATVGVKGLSSSVCEPLPSTEHCPNSQFVVLLIHISQLQLVNSLFGLEKPGYGHIKPSTFECIHDLSVVASYRPIGTRIMQSVITALDLIKGRFTVEHYIDVSIMRITQLYY